MPPRIGPNVAPTAYALKMRLMHRYSQPGHRSIVWKVMPIQIPPEPKPMTNRATK
jgi:hypothetical protein